MCASKLIRRGPSAARKRMAFDAMSPNAITNHSSSPLESLITLVGVLRWIRIPLAVQGRWLGQSPTPAAIRRPRKASPALLHAPTAP